MICGQKPFQPGHPQEAPDGFIPALEPPDGRPCQLRRLATTAIVTRAIAADAPASVLDVLRQHLTGYAPGGETSRWEILLVGPSGSLFDAAGRTAIPAGAPISRAVKQALSGGLGNGPVMLAPTREHFMCVLIPLRNPAGALDGALALMAPADDAARRATRPASRRATPTMKMTTQAGRS